ncbi:MAG: histidine phosphatase family protein [Wenzhouxiangellaceae bacterium]|nr:histidine phosphatase family protein [Wenzhouxiangellaceae bacterium]
MSRCWVLVRHAEATPTGAGMPDRERPLTRAGRRQAAECARWLGEREELSDLPMLVSPARRTQQTAELVRTGWHAGPVRTEAGIWNATQGTLLAILREAGDAILVGHNPGVEMLARSLSGRVVPVGVGAALVFEIDADERVRLVARFQPSSDSA